jgi:asparagine synthase (glutamine-hydrolysing)
MCGIAGIVGSAPRPTWGPLLHRMLDLIAHRGPDDQGVHSIGHGCLGHRRLSIIDLSPAGHQPMLDGQNAVVFNGEIYNHRELRKELEATGARFRSRSDTETLLAGYRFWGPDLVHRLRGMFAFALWDDDARTLFAARDPFGKKPFYYHWDGKVFTFASEVEAVVTGLGARPGIDPSGISHFLLKGYFPRGRSVYSSIQTLKSGACLLVDPEKATVREWEYWNPRFEPALASEEALEATLGSLDPAIELAVRRRFESDVPVGVLLSGGVDSSLISLVSAESMSGRFRTFTATFKGTLGDESRFAALVAERAGTEHLEVEVPMAGLPELLPRLARAYGEPFGDYSSIPCYCLFEALKPHVKVVLTGDGGDEVFAGYKCARLFRFRESTRAIHGLLDFLGFEWLLSLTCSKSRKARETAFALIALRKSADAAWYSLHRDGWTQGWRKRFLRPEVWASSGGAEADARDRKEFNASGSTDLERYLNSHLERLTQGFLVKIDRASMAHAIEARSPLLDIDLFEKVRCLPAAFLLGNGEPKGLLKEMVGRRMGQAFARRPKMGFTPPLSAWLRTDPAARWVEERLTARDSFARSLLEPRSIRKLLDLHRRGQEHASRLWMLLFLSEWHGIHLGAASRS